MGPFGAAPSYFTVTTAGGIPQALRNCACTPGFGMSTTAQCTSDACSNTLNPCMLGDSVMQNGDLDLSSIHVGIFIGGADPSGAVSNIQLYLQGANGHAGLTLNETYVRQGFCSTSSGTYTGDTVGRACSEWDTNSNMGGVGNTFASAIQSCPHDLAKCDYSVSMARMLDKCDLPGKFIYRYILCEFC